MNATKLRIHSMSYMAAVINYYVAHQLLCPKAPGLGCIGPTSNLIADEKPFLDSQILNILNGVEEQKST